MNLRRRLDPAAQLQLERAVLEAEVQSGAEIALVITRDCGDYSAAVWRAGAVLAALSAAALATFAPPLPVASYLLAQGAALGLAQLAARLDPIRRRLVAEPVLAERADAYAARCFSARRTGGKWESRGLLLCVALFERRLIVLAAPGLCSELGAETPWRDIAALARRGFAAGDPVAGLEAALRHCGEVLRRPVAGEIPRSAGGLPPPPGRRPVVIEI